MISPNSPLMPFIQYEESLLSQIQLLTEQVGDLNLQVKNRDEYIQTLKSASIYLQSQLQTAQDSLQRAQEQSKELTREIVIQRVIGAALTFDYENIPYKFGAEYDNNKAFDCSAFIQLCYKIGANVALPRTSRDQSKIGIEVKFEDLLPGDLIFYAFNETGVVSHVSMYFENNQIIHTNTPATGINIKDSSSYKSSIVTIRRII